LSSEDILGQGCQIYLDTIYQNEGVMHIQNCLSMTIKYSKFCNIRNSAFLKAPVSGIKFTTRDLSVLNLKLTGLGINF
jgi:hypothetical protein